MKFYLTALCFFSFFFGLTLFAKETPEMEFLSRSLQVLQLPQVFAIDYTYEQKKRGTEGWISKGGYSLRMDRTVNSFSIKGYSRPDRNEDSLILCQNLKENVGTSFWTDKFKRTLASIEKRTENEWSYRFLGAYAGLFFEYSEFSKFISNDERASKELGKLPINLSLKFVNKDGRKFLRVEDQNPLKPHCVKYTLWFEFPSGVLREAEIGGTVTKEGKIHVEKTFNWKMEDYVMKGGMFFPTSIEIKDCRTEDIRGLRVDKATVRLNEKMDAEVFNVTFPPGTKVRDYIKNTTYLVPALGNAEAEERIVKELDALYEKAQKQK